MSAERSLIVRDWHYVSSFDQIAYGHSLIESAIGTQDQTYWITPHPYMDYSVRTVYNINTTYMSIVF